MFDVLTLVVSPHHSLRCSSRRSRGRPRRSWSQTGSQSDAEGCSTLVTNDNESSIIPVTLILVVYTVLNDLEHLYKTYILEDRKDIHISARIRKLQQGKAKHNYKIPNCRWKHKWTSLGCHIYILAVRSIGVVCFQILLKC